MRIVSWFSCGAASAVASKLALEKSRRRGWECVVAYCEIKEEHPDNRRFLKDCEEWFGQEVLILGNDDYGRSIYQVFEKTGFLKGPTGARCTHELKRVVRQRFQQPDDVVVMGYVAEEVARLKRTLAQSPDLCNFWPILIEAGLTKPDVLAMVERAGIRLPRMYELGYANNNCVGCVKGEAGYWNKIRRDFPDDAEVGFHPFSRMAATERKLNRTVCKREWVENGERKLERIPLDALPPDLGRSPKLPDIECGLLCAAAEDEYTPAPVMEE